MAEDRRADLNLLRVFQELMGELNATRAAERLEVSQAAVSGSLKRLRALYNDPLFVRTQRGLKPTPKAVMLAPLIAQAMEFIDASLEGMGGDAGAAGTLLVRVGLSDDFEMAFGSRIVAAIRRTMPAARVVFRQTNSFMAAQALNDREIDFAITSGGMSDIRLKHAALGSSDYLIVYDRNARKDLGPVSVEEYVAREHILISYSGLTGITDDVLSEHGFRRTVRTASTHFSSLPFLLLGTNAISTIPAHAARAICAVGPFETSPCPLPFPRYAFGLSWRFDLIRKPDLVAARDAVVRLFAEEGGPVEPQDRNPLPGG